MIQRWMSTMNLIRGDNENSTRGHYGYGLCDMVGNVREWCLDAYQSDFYESSPRQNPIAGGSIERVLSNFTKVKIHGSFVEEHGIIHHTLYVLTLRLRDIPCFAVTSVGF